MADDQQPAPAPEGSLYASAVADTPERRRHRRKQALVGVTGAAVVLGGAGIVVSQLMNAQQTSLPEPAAMAPLTVPSPSSAAASASPSAAASASPSATRSRTQPAAAPVRQSPPPPPSIDPSVAAEIAAARASAAADGAPLQRPLTPEPKVRIMSGPVSERSEKTAEGTLRVVTADHDLSGQRELLWAGDRGKPVGNARCTQNFRFSAGTPARERPTMLLCWRTSAGKSVVTVAVAKQGRPSSASSVAVIDREWSR